MMLFYKKHKNDPAIEQKNNHIHFSGDWTRDSIPEKYNSFKKLSYKSSRKIILDGSQIGKLDTAGALVLLDVIHKIKQKTFSYLLEGFSNEHHALIEMVTQEEENLYNLPEVHQDTVLVTIGKETVAKHLQLCAYLSFLGQFITMLFHSITHFTELQWRSFLSSVVDMGYKALPIIALLSFLIGIVLAYQLGVQLQNYGANAFIVNLIGQAILREFGPLITAIIGAGRTSAALTAQLGTMKINDEIAALETMGLSSFDILVIPRVIGALVAFPLLTLWADIFGVFGGMIMTKILYGTQYGDFLSRFNNVIDLQTLLVGLSKAPAFALIIAMVGCFQGLNVTTNADSVGSQTTKSVVQSIFLIIIADAIYAIISSKLGI